MKQNRLVALLLGAGRCVSTAKLLKRSAARQGMELEIVAYELRKQQPIAIEGEVVVGHRWDDDDIVDDIVRVAIEHEADMLLPFSDGAIPIAAKCSEKLSHVFVAMKDVATAELLYNKTLSAEAFQKAGIPSPRTYSIINAEAPVIAKPRRGSDARNIKIFRDIDDLMQLENLSDYMLQELIEDFDEYSVDCYVAASGEILTTVPVKRLEVSSGIVTRAATCRQPELDMICRKVINAFSLKGPVAIEALYDHKRHRFVVTHVASRLSDTAPCAIYAGAPLTDYLIQECRDTTVRPCDDWTDNTLMATYQMEAIFQE